MRFLLSKASKECEGPKERNPNYNVSLALAWCSFDEKVGGQEAR
jgi:hypothetical protein